MVSQGQALWEATVARQLRVVQSLLNECLSNPRVVNFKGGEDKSTPLHEATRNGHTGMVKVLLGHGARTEVKAHDGDTPLSLASQNGHTNVMKVLLQHGAEVEAKDNRGYTPLLRAIRSCHMGALVLLLNHGAQVDSRLCRRYTPLIRALQNWDTGAMEDWLLCQRRGAYKPGNTLLNLLLQNGAEREACNNDAMMPLSQASRIGFCQAKKLSRLRRKGRALRKASRSGQIDIVQSILNDCQYNPAVVNFKTGGCYQTTALHQSSYYGQIAVMEILLSHGAYIEDKASNGWTPLICASQNGQTAAIQVLLCHGAEIEAKANNGSTPLIDYYLLYLSSDRDQCCNEGLSIFHLLLRSIFVRSTFV